MQLFVIIIVGIILYYGQRTIYRKNWYKNLRVEAKFKDKMIEAGEESEIVLTIENKKRLPLPVLNFKMSMPKNFKFKDMRFAVVTDKFYRSESFSVKGYERIKRRLKFTGITRGYFDMTEYNVVIRDLFLISTFAEIYNCAASFYVLPAKLYDDEISELERSVMGEIEVKRSYIEDPFSFVGIREYTVNDSMKKINWKATARSNDLMVNVYSKVADERIVILLNLDSNTMLDVESLRDYSISLASTLTRDFACMGVPVYLNSNAAEKKNPDIKPPKAGSSVAHSIAVDKYLARLDSYGDTDEFIDMLSEYKENIHENATYIIISSHFRDTLINEMDELIGKGLDVRAIAVHNKKVPVSYNRDYIKSWGVDIDAYNQLIS